MGLHRVSDSFRCVWPNVKWKAEEGRAERTAILSKSSETWSPGSSFIVSVLPDKVTNRKESPGGGVTREPGGSPQKFPQNDRSTTLHSQPAGKRVQRGPPPVVSPVPARHLEVPFVAKAS